MPCGCVGHGERAHDVHVGEIARRGCDRRCRRSRARAACRRARRRAPAAGSASATGAAAAAIRSSRRFMQRSTSAAAGQVLPSARARAIMCPLTRRSECRMGRIVVGTDGSKSACAAVAWAAREAALRGAELHVIHAWTPGLAAYPSPWYTPSDVGVEASVRGLADDRGAHLRDAPASRPRRRRRASTCAARRSRAAARRCCSSSPRTPTCSSWARAGTAASSGSCSAR